MAPEFFTTVGDGRGKLSYITGCYKKISEEIHSKKESLDLTPGKKYNFEIDCQRGII